MTRAKKFRLSAKQIEPLVEDMGSCFATDRITVDGCNVGYMYREWADHGIDSGWRFMAGDETQGYMDDSSHHGIYAPNTIANYDPNIISHLSAGVGAAYEWDRKRGAYRQVKKSIVTAKFEFPRDADGDALRRLAADADFSRMMPVDFSVILPEAAKAKEFSKFMKGRNLVIGTEIRKLKSDYRPGFRCDVTVTYMMYVSYDAMLAEQEELAESAAPFGGELDGWGSPGNLQDAS
jgi:hypothetical protein